VLGTISALAQGDGGFVRPVIDWHALAPELVLTAVLCIVLVADLFLPEDRKALLPSLAGLGLLAALIPVLTLAVDGADRSLFGGTYVVDNFALVVKALFLVAGYVTVLQSTNYIAEGDYPEGEYYFLLLSSILGMTVMGSARDLVTIFVALELLSVPVYLLAGWRKHDPKGNEAGAKYYLMGVFASGVLLYGMSLLYGVAGSTKLSDIGAGLGGESVPAITLAIVFCIAGFGFKVSAVPFHTWAPDTYEGAPTPITAFLSVSSKAAGFVALLQLVIIGFAEQPDVVRPLMWVLSALSMTIGNVVALRQTNVVRMLAYSGISQAGFMLAPLAVVGQIGDDTLTSIVTYLVIYAAMNLGAFTVVMAVARKTGSAEVSSFGGLFDYAPPLAVLMSLFLFSLAGIPPLGGWLAKLVAFRAVIDADTGWAYALAVVMAVNSVIALAYYANITKEMWMNPTPGGDKTPVRVPVSLTAALVITAGFTLLFGITQWATELGDMASFVASIGP
jgi:NADH-quinone oxidoreductase subunit N